MGTQFWPGKITGNLKEYGIAALCGVPARINRFLPLFLILF
jgi:hypothetical protein